MTAAEVHALGEETFGGRTTLDRLRDPDTGTFLAPVRVDGSDVVGLPEGVVGPLLAIVDTGLDAAHPWIARTLRDSIDLTGEGSEDRNGHGTWVALLALWFSDMPCGLLNAKALRSDGNGTIDALARGIRWASRQGATFINVSAGISQPDCRGGCLVCEAALSAARAGAVVSVAAGNIAGETTCPAKAALFYPGAGVHAFGALDPATFAPEAYSGTAEAYLPSFRAVLLPVDSTGGGSEPGEETRAHATALALMQRAARDTALGHVARAERLFDQIVERFGNSSYASLRAQAARALINKGFTLRQAGRHDEELLCYRDAIDRYGPDLESVVHAEVVTAHGYAAGTMESLGAFDAALAEYGQIIREDRGHPSRVVRDERARALLGRGVLLSKLGRSGEALADFQRLVSEYGVSADQTPVRTWVTRGWLNQGALLAACGKDADALSTYTALLSELWFDEDLDARRAAVAAMFNRGNCLRRLGREAEAIESFDQVIERFANDTDTGVRGLVETARSARRASG